MFTEKNLKVEPCGTEPPHRQHMLLVTAATLLVCCLKHQSADGEAYTGAPHTRTADCTASEPVSCVESLADLSQFLPFLHSQFGSEQGTLVLTSFFFMNSAVPTMSKHLSAHWRTRRDFMCSRCETISHRDLISYGPWGRDMLPGGLPMYPPPPVPCPAYVGTASLCESGCTCRYYRPRAVWYTSR